MALLSSVPSAVAVNTTIFPSLFPYSRSKPQNPRYGVHYAPCRASKEDQSPNFNSPGPDSGSSRFDRRDVLLGLGGLYGVANVAGDRSAFADPIETPNVSNCGPGIILEPGTNRPVKKINCCPPSPDEIFDFFPPPSSGTFRVRRPAHAYTAVEKQKFENAIQKMKDLDSSDPRSFGQQAKIHCAYCNNSYEQDGFSGIDLQVHFNWLFFPFHRCYLYFYERILGHLINDPTFSLPYWNWDNSPGMQMPIIYDYGNPKSPLYDEKRNQLHRPPAKLNLEYDGNENPPFDVIQNNCTVMYRQMITNAKTPEQFFGQPIRAGDPAIDGMGSIENVPHNNIHFWGGDTRTEFGEDMGNFYSAGNDPLFFGLHANVDRMWNIWKLQLGNGKNRDFTDTDWLDTSFIFYDENKHAVRIRVRDCLDSKNQLGYYYEDAELPWLNCKPKPSQGRPLSIQPSPAPQAKVPEVSFPLILNSKITTVVRRPKKSRSRREKNEEDEVLVIEGIEFDRGYRIHFDVLVNAPDNDSQIYPVNSEFAGSFTSVPHLHKHNNGGKPKTTLRLVITELLEDLVCDDDETVTVTLIPKVGAGKVTIGGIGIKYISLS